MKLPKIFTKIFKRKKRPVVQSTNASFKEKISREHDKLTRFVYKFKNPSEQVNRTPFVPCGQTAVPNKIATILKDVAKFKLERLKKVLHKK